MNKQTVEALRYLLKQDGVINIIGDLPEPKIPVQEFLDLKKMGFIDAGAVITPANKVKNPISLYEVRITSLGRDYLEQRVGKVVNAGIYVEGGSDNFIGGNEIVGYEKGVYLKDSKSNTVIENRVLTEDVATIFQNLKRDIATLDVDELKNKELSNVVKNMEVSFGTDSFTNAYKEFSTFLSDHATIWGAVILPLYPYLAQLADYLT